jgi:hypothetical protein
MVRQAEKAEAAVMVYVDAPTYTEKSNGIRCLYQLANALANRGHSVWLVPRSPVGFFKLIPDEFCGLQIARQPGHNGEGVFICSESVPAAKVQAARNAGTRVIWWYMAPHGLLEKPRITPQEGEAICCFSSYVLPDSAPSFFFQPPFDEAWKNEIGIFRPTTSHKRRCMGLYTGKGRLRPLPEELQRFLFGAEIKLFTRATPKSRSKLFRQLQQCDGLITFDELTQLNFEAATLGVPIFLANPLFPPESCDSFPVPISDYISDSAPLFFEQVRQRRNGTLKPLGLQGMLLFNINKECILRFEAVIGDPATSPAVGEGHQIDRLISFGRHLRNQRILLPCDNGQAPSARLIRAYVDSFSYSRNFHLLVSGAAFALDVLGVALFALKVPKILSSMERLISRMCSSLPRR